MLCLVFDLSDEEALEWIIKASRDHSALIPFNRIVLAINYVRTKYAKPRRITSELILSRVGQNCPRLTGSTKDHSFQNSPIPACWL